MMQIIYNGVEITDRVDVNRCYHDMYAAGRSDTLNLHLNDVANLWDKWAPQKGDMIRVEHEAISTGDMFISSVLPQNGAFGIMAQAAPSTGFDLQSKSWQQVHLLQIAREIAQRNGLTFSSYGVEDRLYPYIVQNNEGDFHLLSRLALREGCAILIYNKSLILYDERHMEAQAPHEVLNIAADVEYKYNDRRFNLYGSCIVENDSYSGTFAVDNGSVRVYRPENVGSIGSNAEAQRFAKNLLRSVNKGCYGGYIRPNILPGYSAGSMVNLNNPRAPSWDGAVFIDHIRNDYSKSRSKIFFRKPLEGY